MTDVLLASMGLLGSDPIEGADREKAVRAVAERLRPLISAIQTGIVAQLTALEWASLSSITREAIELAIRGELIPQPELPPLLNDDEQVFGAMSDELNRLSGVLEG